MAAASTYPRRPTVRLPAYHYARPAAYFITICTHQRALLERPDHAAAVLVAWEDLPRHYAHVSLDQFVVLPNHVHGIVLLADADMARIREYIAVNPERWGADGENPAGRPDASERTFWAAHPAARRPGGRV